MSLNYVAFKFKGKLTPKHSVFSRVGVGMEGPNELGDVSPKFGLESDVSGQYCWLVTADGVSRVSRGLLIPEKNSGEQDSKLYHFYLTKDKLSVAEGDGTITQCTAGLPKVGRIRSGMRLGIKTLNDEQKSMLVRCANLYYA